MPLVPPELSRTPATRLAGGTQCQPFDAAVRLAPGFTNQAYVSSGPGQGRSLRCDALAL